MNGGPEQGQSDGSARGTSRGGTSRGRHRALTNVLCLVGVMTATFAWSSMLYMRTWGDPATGPRIATAVLADPTARAEIAEPLTAYVTSIVGDANRPLVAGIVDDALSDPRSLGAVAQRFSPLASLGGVDVGGFSSLLDERLSELDEQIGSSVGGRGLPFPDLRVPAVASLSTARSTISAWSLRAAFVAFCAFAAAFVVGDRRVVARRYGMWAIITSAVLLVAPYVVTAGASRWMQSMDATARIVVDAYMAPVRWRIIALALSGAVVWASPYVVGAMSAGTTVGRGARSTPRRPIREAALHTELQPAMARRERAHGTDHQHTSAADDRFGAPEWGSTTVVATTNSRPSTSSEPATEPDDIDVWAAYGARPDDDS